MATWLLTWNPRKFDWTDLPRDARATRNSKAVRFTWACGNTRRIQRGDRVFLIRQGVEPRGIVAAGQAVSASILGERWDNAKRQGYHVDARWTEILDPDEERPLAVAGTGSGPLSHIHWGTQKSGIQIADEAAAELEVAWAAHLGTIGRALELTDEIADGPLDAVHEADVGELDEEGRRRLHKHLRAERSSRNRALVLATRADSLRCDCCEFDPIAVFGPSMALMLDVHHTVPVASGRRVPKLSEFALLCPTCHRAAHYKRKDKPLTPKELLDLRAPLGAGVKRAARGGR